MQPQEQTPRVLSYHGGSDRRMYFYKTNDNPPNLHLWDFIDPVDLVCSNHKKITNNSYQCCGHEDGDKMYPSYHGMPHEGSRLFFLYPKTQKLPNPQWDFHDMICNNCEQLEEE